MNNSELIRLVYDYNHVFNLLERKMAVLEIVVVMGYHKAFEGVANHVLPINYQILNIATSASEN